MSASASLAVVKPKTAIEKRTRTTVDTIMLTPERIAKWKLPCGQRPLKVNKKVLEIVDVIREDGGVVPGILTLGIFEGTNWIIDGQHRIHAFKLTELKEGYADARFVHAESMADINREFVRLNSKLVTMRPDDFLRGLENSIPALTEIRRACPFVGYDQIRRGTSGPIVSMSAALRNWRGSSMDTPGSTVTNMSTVDLAESMLDEDTRGLIDFLVIANKAFGREPQYARLWTALNMVLCMWMYRKLVLTQYSPKTPRLTKDQFLKCLLSVSADSSYQDWLLGRLMGERDRSPAYARLKSIFSKRLEVELQRRVQLPQPDWSN
jgi:hypothetical protein